MKGLISRVEAEAGRLDVLVHCAGLMSVLHKSGLAVPEDGGSLDHVQDLMMSENEADWAAQFAVNVTAVYFLTAGFLHLLKKSSEFWAKESEAACNSANRSATKPEAQPEPTRTAQVITTTGIAAYFRSFSSCMGYSASKAAIQHLMKTMATTFAAADIRFVSY